MNDYGPATAVSSAPLMMLVPTENVSDAPGSEFYLIQAGDPIQPDREIVTGSFIILREMSKGLK